MGMADAAGIWRLNFRLSTEVLTEAAAEIEALGIEAKEFFVLDGVEEQGYPAELAAHLSMPRPTMTLHLKHLQAKGLVVREIDPDDLRRHRLALTASGRDLVTKARDILSGRYAKRLCRLSDREQGEFARLLDKLTS